MSVLNPEAPLQVLRDRQPDPAAHGAGKKAEELLYRVQVGSAQPVE